MMVMYTPTPWKVERNADGRVGTFIKTVAVLPHAQTGRTVAKMSMVAEYGDAEHIVRAVNALPDIVELLNEVREYFDNLSDADHDGTGFVPNAEMRFVNQIDEALAKAGAA